MGMNTNECIKHKITNEDVANTLPRVGNVKRL
jgi:hypothetical protein